MPGCGLERSGRSVGSAAWLGATPPSRGGGGGVFKNKESPRGGDAAAGGGTMAGRTHNFRFPAATTHLMVGPSGSGKTYRTAQILKLKDEIIECGASIDNVVVCYAAWQPIYDELKESGHVTSWVNKMPTNEEFIELVEPYKDRGGSIVVIDDFMGKIDQDLAEIVRVSSRHYNTTTFILFQSLFPPHKLARQISLNVKFLHIHKNPRENAQIQYLARQLAPESYRWIVEAYHKVTEKPYSCLLIDLTQQCHQSLRFRSDYLPSEWPMRLWKQRGTSIEEA